MNKTNFKLKDMERVNMELGIHTAVLYITFQATDQNAVDVTTASKTFQAKVLEGCPGYPYKPTKPVTIIIKSCRLKPAAGQGGIAGNSPKIESAAWTELELVCYDYTPYAKLAIKYYSKKNVSHFSYLFAAFFLERVCCCWIMNHILDDFAFYPCGVCILNLRKLGGSVETFLKGIMCLT